MNHFHAAGGMGFLIGQLLGAGLLHDDVRTVSGQAGSGATAGAGLRDEAGLAAVDAQQRRTGVLAPAAKPFSPDGGLKSCAAISAVRSSRCRR